MENRRGIADQRLGNGEGEDPTFGPRRWAPRERAPAQSARTVVMDPAAARSLRRVALVFFSLIGLFAFLRFVLGP